MLSFSRTQWETVLQKFTGEQEIINNCCTRCIKLYSSQTEPLVHIGQLFIVTDGSQQHHGCYNKSHGHQCNIISRTVIKRQIYKVHVIVKYLHLKISTDNAIQFAQRNQSKRRKTYKLRSENTQRNESTVNLWIFHWK